MPDPRFRIEEPLTRRERLADCALGVAGALILAALVAGIVLLAMLGMAA